MSFEFLVASRYLKSTRGSHFLRFMTVVAIGSVAIGTAALTITFTILDGFERELRGNIIGISSHIRVGTFRNVSFGNDQDKSDTLRHIKNVSAASPFLERQAMVLARESIDGVLVKGIPKQEDISELRNRIVAGSYRLDSIQGKPAVVMGKSLASRFGLHVGDKVVLLEANVQNILQVPKVQCVLSGIYETGMAEYFDDVYVFVDLPIAQRLFSLPNHINGYDVLCRDILEVESTVNMIQTVLGYPMYPRSAFSIYRNLFVWIDLQQKLIPVVVGSLILISTFNIIATLLLFVMDKTQDVGIFVSLGASRKTIRRMFRYQGAIVGCIGVLLGSGIAFVLCFIQQEFKIMSLPQGIYYMTSVPIFMKPHVFLLTAVVAMTLSLLSSIIPAWLASRMNPIKSIRFH